MKTFTFRLFIVAVLPHFIFISSARAFSPDFSSPESVIETFYQALKEHNSDVLSQCIHPESQQRRALEYYSRTIPESELKRYEEQLGEYYGVTEVEEDNPKSSLGWIRVTVEFYAPDGRLKVYKLYVKQHDMGYRIIQI